MTELFRGSTLSKSERTAPIHNPVSAISNADPTMTGVQNFRLMPRPSFDSIERERIPRVKPFRRVPPFHPGFFPENCPDSTGTLLGITLPMSSLYHMTQ
jgi:hypothetical protein